MPNMEEIWPYHVMLTFTLQMDPCVPTLGMNTVDQGVGYCLALRHGDKRGEGAVLRTMSLIMPPQ